MRDELLAYLLGDLGPEERQRITERLESDPVWQRELELLESCIEAHEADPKSSCHPTDLVDRTCSFVQDVTKSNPGLSPENYATLSESQDPATNPARWSFADYAVAAGVVLVLGMLLLPALRESRDTARRAKCQTNLRDLGIALIEYADRSNRGLPHVDFNENAGSFVVDLAESNIVSREQLRELLVCPSSPLADRVSSGTLTIRIPTPHELETASKKSLVMLLQSMAGSYAYRFGYHDQNGHYRQVAYKGSSDAPMLGDAPCISVAGFQSPNHDACGQNVIFQDLSVRYFKQCSQNQNTDYYLNDNQQHAAGRHIRDFVLGRSEASPSGN